MTLTDDELEQETVETMNAIGRSNERKEIKTWVNLHGKYGYETVADDYYITNNEHEAFDEEGNEIVCESCGQRLIINFGDFECRNEECETFVGDEE